MRRLLTYQVAPEYPEAARQANVQGTVVLSAVIGRDGTVHDLRPLSGAEVLRPAALEAVRWWRFQPYRINGEAVEVETTVAIEFHND
jgi:protein TonB